MVSEPSSAGRWVRALRHRRRLSQRELAALAGVPVSTVSRVESGAVDARFSTFEALLAASHHEFAVRDDQGYLLIPEPRGETERDRGGRHHPAHLRLFRTPNFTSIHYRDWWGWERIAFTPDDPNVPAYTYWRRPNPPVAVPLPDCVERGRLWDDAT